MDFEFTGEMQQLLDQFVDGTISDDGLARLDQALRSQSEAVESFLDYCQLHIDLTIDLRADQALESFRDRQQRMAAPVAAAPTIAAPLAASDGDVPFLPSPAYGLFGYSRFFALGITTCALMLTVAAGMWWWKSSREADDRAPLPTVFAGDMNTPHITSVKLASGSTKLTLAGIGSVVVEGPADFELTGPMRARLNQGRIKVHVTESSGYGFVVETPQGEIKDLGTIFGLDVVDKLNTGLFVFQGAVDLRVGATPAESKAVEVQHLFGGDGVRISEGGQLVRIMSVVTGNTPTFQWRGDTISSDPSTIIARVTDNIRTGEMKKFYEIVPRGMCEDATAYVDRQEHEWNGVTSRGMPSYLIGADYVKPFNNDKMRQDVELEVTLSVPARLLVFFDDRVPPPEWLKEQFRPTRDHIGLDMGESFDERGRPITNRPKGIGPGVSIDQTFSIWERTVSKAGKVVLGPPGGSSQSSAMYGIAALPLDTEIAKEEK